MGASITFEPGARTAWHTYPLGQTLIVTAGCVAPSGGAGRFKRFARSDVISIAAGQKHWHGASPTTAMTHIAIHEQLDGSSSGWNT
jgi:quercetin dioxygenase-like cupin family protein